VLRPHGTTGPQHISHSSPRADTVTPSIKMNSNKQHDDKSHETPVENKSNEVKEEVTKKMTEVKHEDEDDVVKTVTTTTAATTAPAPSISSRGEEVMKMYQQTQWMIASKSSSQLSLFDVIAKSSEIGTDEEWNTILTFKADSFFNSRDFEGRLPLHYAAEEEAPLHIIQYLASNIKPKPTLSHLIIAKMWNQVILQATSFSADQVDYWNRTPIIWAIETCAPVAVLKALAQHFPNGCKTCDTKQRRYALHYASEYLQKHVGGIKAGTELCRQIMEAYPHVCSCKDTSYGALPVFLAASNGGGPELVHAMLEHFKEAARARDSSGYSLLSYAAGCNLTQIVADVRTLKLIIDAYPSALKHADPEFCCLPVHWACYDSTQPVEVVQILLEHYPESLFVRDQTGKLPLMYAVQRDCIKEWQWDERLLKLVQFLYNQMMATTTSCANNNGTKQWKTTFACNKPSQELKPASSITKSDLLKVLQDARSPEIVKWGLKLECYLQRYQLSSGRAVHSSSTAKVHLALDLSEDPPVKVALKWMRHRHQFLREVKLRQEFSEGSHVVGVRGWHVPHKDQTFVNHELSLTNPSPSNNSTCMNTNSGDSSLPYLLVMESGGSSLFHILASQRIAGIDANKCSSLFKNLVQQVSQLHMDGVVHCDIKPRNVLCTDKEEQEEEEEEEQKISPRRRRRRRSSSGIHEEQQQKHEHEFSLQLCDLDAALPIGQVFPPKMKKSTAYLAPEAAIHHANEQHGIGSTLVADTSLDVWSLGVVLFELCTGQHLFSQDMGNDNMVKSESYDQLCVWLVINDERLECCFDFDSDNANTVNTDSTTTTDVTDMICTARQRSDAKHLIRWCLQSDPKKRPSIKQILNHRFLGGNEHPPIQSFQLLAEGGLPILSTNSRRMKYHYFISHMQSEASGDVGTLFLMLTSLGMQCWRDMNQANITEAAMKQGVFDSSVFILFLTNSVLSRPFCLKEIGWAIQFQKPIIIIVENESRFWAWDKARWENDQCTRARDGSWIQGDLSISFTNCPLSVKQMINKEEKNKHFLPFRRRDFEVQGLVQEIVRRSTKYNIEWGNQYTFVPKMQHVLGNRSIRFLSNNSKAAKEIEQHLQTSLRERTTYMEWSHSMDAATQVLVLLSHRLIDRCTGGQSYIELEQAIQSNKNIIYMYVKDEWDFGLFYSSSNSIIKTSISSHEALVYRPLYPEIMAYEHNSLVVELLKRMPVTNEKNTNTNKSQSLQEPGEEKKETTGAVKQGVDTNKEEKIIHSGSYFGGKDLIIYPRNNHKHTHTVILLHGLYGSGIEFQALPGLLDSLMRRVHLNERDDRYDDSVWDGIKFIFPTAPVRTISWPTGPETNVQSWYDYFTDCSGKDEFDQIDLKHLNEMTTILQNMINEEMVLLERNITGSHGDARRRVMLGGCSQGGTLALHAVLSRSWSLPPYLVALRTIVLEETITAAAQVVSSPPTLTVQVFSAEMDQVFVENLRKRSFQSLENIGHQVCHHVEVGLDHVTDSMMELYFVAKRISIDFFNVDETFFIVDENKARIEMKGLMTSDEWTSL
jgi:serine/threonine protein kinase/predicted esterase